MGEGWGRCNWLEVIIAIQAKSTETHAVKTACKKKYCTGTYPKLVGKSGVNQAGGAHRAKPLQWFMSASCFFYHDKNTSDNSHRAINRRQRKTVLFETVILLSRKLCCGTQVLNHKHRRKKVPSKLNVLLSSMLYNLLGIDLHHTYHYYYSNTF